MNLFRIGILVSFLLLANACTKKVGELMYVDYPTQIGKIIVNKCAVSGCHNANSYTAAGDYNLSTWSDMFSGASSGSPVIPFNSRFSSLCYAINTYPDLGTQTQPSMPLNKQPLSKEEVMLIQNWIDAGAPDKNGTIKWSDLSPSKKLYAVNQGCDVVTIFDAETHLPCRYIPVGNKGSIESPHQIRVSPDGKYWYVIFINNNVMQKYSTANDQLIGEIPLTPFAQGSGNENNLDWNTFVITSDSKKAYCVSWTQNGRVAAVDLENMKLLHYSASLYFPHGIALNKNETKLYVASQTGNFITELDTAFSTANTLSLDDDLSINYASSVDPHDMILTPDGNELAITCQAKNEVRIFNVNTLKTRLKIPTGVYPQEIIYVKSTGCYYVSCTEDQTTYPSSHGVITKIDAVNFEPENIACGYQPHGIAADNSKKVLYVLSRNISGTGPAPHHSSQCSGRNGFINFIDLNSFTILSHRYELSVDPYFICASP